MNNDIFDISTQSKRSVIIRYVIQIVIVLSIIISFGIYIGNILFGNNSIEVLTNIQTQQSYLKEKISYLQKDNANLQKEYFELKNLEPE
jgi:uncharacterized membrane protein